MASSLARTGSAEIHGGGVVLSDTKVGTLRSAGFHQVLNATGSCIFVSLDLVPILHSDSVILSRANRYLFQGKDGEAEEKGSFRQSMRRANLCRYIHTAGPLRLNMVLNRRLKNILFGHETMDKKGPR